MTRHDRIRISVATARYLEALENDDRAEIDALWKLAASDPMLMASFREIHSGLLEEYGERDTNSLRSAVASAVEKHMPSADPVRQTVGPVTASDVADELFRHPPARLAAEMHQFNDKLRSIPAPLPKTLGLSTLVAWGESLFGPATAEYWKAFQQAAIKLESQRSFGTEYQLAARPGPRGEGGQ
jgi:hypothetical protein